MQRKFYPDSFKLTVIRFVEEGNSTNKAAKKFEVDHGLVEKWVSAYKYHGLDGILFKADHPNKYDGDFKVMVVEYIQEHSLSNRKAAAMFGIPSTSTIVDWKQKYLREGAEALRKNSRKKEITKAQLKKQQSLANAQEREKELLARIEYLEMENEYLKKLNALVQARESSKKETK